MNTKSPGASAKSFTPEPLHPSEVELRALYGNVESAWALLRDDREAAEGMLYFMRYLKPADYLDETTHQKVMLFLLRSQALVLRHYEDMLADLVYSEKEQEHPLSQPHQINPRSEQMSTEINTFNWGEIALSQVVYKDGIPHATRYAIGEWLEYEDPAEGIRKILNRNSYIEDHSVPVKLTATDGKNYDTLIYHPIGFLLIVMESGQPKAQAMKQAAAEFVWHFAGPRSMSFKERADLMKHRRILINDITKTKDAFGQMTLLTDLREVSLALEQAVPDVKYLGKDIDQLALPGV